MRTFALAALLVLAACRHDDGDDSGAGGTTVGGSAPNGIVSDFSLVDVNPNSATHGQAVSPRDHLGRVPAYYFAHAT